MTEDRKKRICPFCQHPVTDSDELFCCPRCGIPHHLDCWRENKGCTTYACRGAVDDPEAQLFEQTAEFSRLAILFRRIPVMGLTSAAVALVSALLRLFTAVNPPYWIFIAALLLGVSGMLKKERAPAYALTGMGIAAFFIFQAAMALFGPTPVINVPLDYPTIQQAVAAAPDGAVVIVEPGTYRENIDFMGKRITVRSTDPDDGSIVASTVIDGGKKASVVTFAGEETGEAVLSGFTITGGFGSDAGVSIVVPGDIIESEEELSGEGSSFGGGIAVLNGSSPLVEKNIITGNTALNGGGIGVSNSSPTIRGNVIRDNSALIGGGLHLDNSSAKISSNLIINNRADYDGGGVAVFLFSSPVIEGNEIRGNLSRWGGALSANMESSPMITGNSIYDNYAENGGGALVVNDSSPLVLNNLITDNQSGLSGGAIYTTRGSFPVIEGNTLKNNNAEMEGGAITVTEGSMATVAKNIFENNRAESGGAILVSESSFLQLNEPDDNIYESNYPDDLFRS